MHTFVLAAVVGLASVPAFAGPSDHQSREPGDYSVTERPELRRQARDRNAPYALTGQRQQRRIVVIRDVPRGRGRTESVAFYKWVSE